MNYCLKCGNPLIPGETVCRVCGEPLQVSPNVPGVDNNNFGLNVPPTVVNGVNMNPSSVAFSSGMPEMAQTPFSIAPTMPEVAPSPVSVAPTMPEVSSSPVSVAPAMPEMAQTPVSIAPAMPAAAPSPVSIAPAMPEVAPSTVSVAPAMPEVAPSPVSVAPTMPEVAPSPVSIAPAMPEVAPSPVSIAPAMPEVAPSPVSVAPTMPEVAPSPLLINDDLKPSDGDLGSLQNSKEDKKIRKEKSSKGNKLILILVLIVSVAALGVMIFFMYNMFSANNKLENEFVEKVKEYHYEGFNLYVPTEMYAEIYNGDFYIGDAEKTWSAVMSLGTGTYNTFVSNKSQLVDYFREMGYEATEPVEREIGATSFVTTEVMMGSKNVLVAYAKANGTQIFSILLENQDGVYTDDNLKPIGSILSTMKYVGRTYELPEGLDFSHFKRTFRIGE